MLKANQRLAHPETLKRLNLVCGITLAVCFFLPYAEVGSEILMTWDVAAKVSQFAFLMIFPIIAGLGLIVLAMLPNIHTLARSIITLMVGVVPLIVLLAVTKHVAALASRTAPTNVLFILGLVALSAGLIHRMLQPGSVAARVIIGLGMLLTLLHYLIPRSSGLLTERAVPLVGLFQMLSSGEGLLVFMGILWLLPFLGMFFAAIALPRSTGDRGMETGISVLGWFFFSYLPMVSFISAFISLVLNPGVHVVGMVSVGAMVAAYLTSVVFGTSHMLAAIAQPGQAAPQPAQSHCSNCGATNADGNEVCWQCSTPIGPPMPSPGPAFAPSAPPPQMLIIGRDDDCGYILPETMKGAGRKHARVVIEAGMVFLEDLGSVNGTFLNGKQIHRAPLKPGDRVRFGKSAQELSAYELLHRLGF